MGDDARDHGWACMSFASYHNAYRSRDELLTEMMQRIVDGEMARCQPVAQAGPRLSCWAAPRSGSVPAKCCAGPRGC